LGNLNPYYGRFMASASSSLIGEAVAASPTFFTLWLGTDDVMQYAIKGGDTGGDSITPISIFRQAMSGVVSGLISNGAKGVLANIPDISVMPYFTTIPIKGLPLDAAKAAQLNGMFATYNAGAAAYGVPPMQFQEGANYWIIEDNNFPYDSLGGLRQIRPGEFLTLKLPQDSLKCALWGSPLKPIPANFVVDAGEILKIKAATLQFNEFISGLASEQGLALVDIYSLFNSLSAGLVYDGIKFNSVFVQGGFYSLDGLHPNPRGNAIIANSFIDAINGMYGCKIPSVKVSDFPGTTFP
ncbi:MAG: hypothetical protein NTU44_11090, partial [Bacteroidetes bacterium]|nr:hypothetical protein [Bacteroidota bacterium]